MNSGSQESSTSTPVASQQLEPMDTQATLVNTQSQQMDSQPNTQLTQSAEAIARDKEREMAELLITMDNYKAIVRFDRAICKDHYVLIIDLKFRYPMQLLIII
jgi:hypothetical protein